MMLALAIHCTADGVALAAGHEAQASEVPGGRMLDLSLVLAICVHKIPEGLALGALLLGAGFKPTRVILRVAAVEATTLLGGVLGWHAVLGEISKHHKALVLVSFGIGFGVIGTLTLVLGHH
jgi:zinc transporter ZupT